jgi:hypothetical protein
LFGLPFLIKKKKKTSRKLQSAYLKPAHASPPQPTARVRQAMAPELDDMTVVRRRKKACAQNARPVKHFRTLVVLHLHHGPLFGLRSQSASHPPMGSMSAIAR